MTHQQVVEALEQLAKQLDAKGAVKTAEIVRASLRAAISNGVDLGDWMRLGAYTGGGVLNLFEALKAALEAEQRAMRPHALQVVISMGLLLLFAAILRPFLDAVQAYRSQQDLKFFFDSQRGVRDTAIRDGDYNPAIGWTGRPGQVHPGFLDYPEM